MHKGDMKELKNNSKGKRSLCKPTTKFEIEIELDEKWEQFQFLL